MAINKIIYGGNVLIDLTGDSASADKILRGFTTHAKSGEQIEGTCDFDVDSSKGDAVVSEILLGKTAYARGTKLVGTMINNESVTGEISSKSEEYTIPIGYHDGGGKVSISAAEKEKLISGNIRKGATILGVEGGYEGAAVKGQSKTVTPSSVAQTIQPDEGFNALTSVTVNAIPYEESPNSAGGTTVTIGG